MDVTFVGVSGLTKAFNNTVLLLPSGVQEGDLLLAHVYVQGSYASFSPPSGWTLLASVVAYDIGDNIDWYYKYAGASESDLAISNSAINVGGFIEAYRNVNPTTPSPSAPIVETAQSGTPKKTPSTSISVSVDGSLVVQACVQHDDGGGISVRAANSEGFTQTAGGNAYSTAQGTDWAHASARKNVSIGTVTLPSFDGTSGIKWAFMAWSLQPKSQQKYGWGVLI